MPPRSRRRRCCCRCRRPNSCEHPTGMHNAKHVVGAFRNRCSEVGGIEPVRDRDDAPRSELRERILQACRGLGSVHDHGRRGASAWNACGKRVHEPSVSQRDRATSLVQRPRIRKVGNPGHSERCAQAFRAPKAVSYGPISLRTTATRFTFVPVRTARLSRPTID